MRKLFVLLALLLAGCDEWVEPRWIEGPPAPGSSLEGPAELTIAEGAAGSLLLVHGFRSWSGQPGTATNAVSHDPTIAAIARTLVDRVVESSQPEYGHVFVLWGLRAGETDIDVFDGDEHFATIHVQVLPQAP